MCCHRSAEPPFCASKKCAPSWRSRRTIASPAVSGGMAKRMSTEVQSIVHTKKGTFHRAMPGARIARRGAMKLAGAGMGAPPLSIKAQGPGGREVGSGGGGEGALGQRGVGEPADGRGAASREAEVDEQAAEQGRPEAQRVEARKGHVAGPDHERNQIVAHADQDRNAHEE